MRSPVAEYDVGGRLFQGLLVLRDPGCAAWAERGAAAVAECRRRVVVAAGGHLVCGSLSDAAGLRLRLWYERPPAPAAGGDGSRLVWLRCPTGGLRVEHDITAAALQVRLPAGPGSYRVRVCWHGRERTRRAILAAYLSLRPGAPPGSGTPLDIMVAGVERFDVDVWPAVGASAGAGRTHQPGGSVRKTG